MRPSKEGRRAESSQPRGGGRGRGRATTPPPQRSKLSPPSAALSDQSSTADLIAEFEDLRVSADSSNSEYNPRSFPYSVKQQCWDKAEKVKGRDPDRWRRDPLGNIVFRKLVGCPGCLCHDYDHILPYSKATVNRSKGNRTDISRADLIQKSSYCRVSGRDMDLIELSAYGNIRRGEDNSGGCNIQ
ncbi:hypothetical protein Cgig2_006132 [Carnegiea gigantea]|uniref:HNH endonuclease n=1 Tax=Carnegiea gigantea TaxID=171969 RepID=A0A9Q1L1D6_9CARY|nr:hypothetical protein Cgig2_006132 [Carnegiea gigantea]